ncbi:uncharacterized protein TEOVI_000451200 [Trypanosoma equiperdum]|uniref:Uncharacterized protein n=4 Tax=Trypanozoon TaxID=39700 RepID=Q386V2_TRYB2|nr:hypothetical protein, conserved [Trypanosoma brucei gambiense DAL972]XP_828291.1 hypothetical protein, conserved [Trypanosoma brucei brucei TREU927]RHW68406.1 hypothetical protein DPX39_110026900 [Trypanosoma brucei equiperdum]SCU72928.1 hypothetical protein, conserved [Trypanosoma equiperdum]EAN79179.1 hypothetical protein, conserved [Trypanosoma brucei brucei TREU927]CBH17109.1 hypothetical protein, conserved [Trypanosoma brucei gambiense DAL972]|eukprot:XP_011779373.1 hypothetical protein, conserved [Trypanosoma brucei gambiense DAL972]
MVRSLVVLLTYDEPECGGAADALVVHLQRDCAALADRCQLSARPISILQNSSHRDALYRTLQDLIQVKPQDIYAISFLKDNNPDEYRKIRELCNGVKPRRIKHQILTHLANYNDVGLIIRNLVRLVLDEMSRDV